MEDMMEMGKIQGKTRKADRANQLRMAKPRKIYENRLDDGTVEYMVTDQKGLVTLRGVLPYSEYSTAVEQYSAQGWELRRIDINPFFAEQDFVYQSDLDATRSFKRAVATGLVLLMATAGTMGYVTDSRMKERINNGLDGMMGEINSLIDAKVGKIEGRIDKVETDNKKLEAEIRRLGEVVGVSVSRINAARVAKSPSPVEQAAPEQRRPVERTIVQAPSATVASEAIKPPQPVAEHKSARQETVKPPVAERKPAMQEAATATKGEDEDPLKQLNKLLKDIDDGK